MPVNKRFYTFHYFRPRHDMIVTTTSGWGLAKFSLNLGIFLILLLFTSFILLCNERTIGIRSLTSILSKDYSVYSDMIVTVAKWKLASTVENQNITSAKHILFVLHSKSGLVDNVFIFFPVWNILRKHFGWICYKTLMFILQF